MKRKWLIAIPIVLVLAGICALSVLAAWTGFRNMSISHFNLRLPSLFQMNSVAESDDSQSFSVGTPLELVVDHHFGRVEVRGSDTQEIKVDIHRTAYGYNPTHANQRLAELGVKFTPETNRLTIKVDAPAQNDSNPGSVDLVISVPLETSVKVTSQAGEVKVDRVRGNIDLDASFSPIEVTNVQDGSLKIRSNSGSITVSQVLGSQPIDLRTDFGNLSLVEADGSTVTIYTNSGTVDMEAVKASGKVDITGQFGSVTYKTGEAASLLVTSNSGEVKLENLVLKGPVEVHSDFGAMTLDKVDASGYVLGSNNGAISLNGASGNIQARSDFGNLELRNVQNGNLTLKSLNGSITFRGSLGDGPHTVETDFGNVLLQMPADEAFTFDLKTQFGKIASDYEITLQGAMDATAWQGKVNGGGASLSVKTNNGNITLETFVTKE